MTPSVTVDSCPVCGSGVFDNRAKKAAGEYNQKAPDLKCKNKDCDWRFWPGDSTGDAAEPRPHKVISYATPTAATWQDVHAIWGRSYAEAQKELGPGRALEDESLVTLTAIGLALIAVAKGTPVIGK